ncbi:MAG TPA: hypothetical protein VFB79_02910 [Candidatus Angelobacter sp.]|nr:hypothetical protein [Candidatus Angelobacter sp.]
MLSRLWLLLIIFWGVCSQARADVALLLEEPYGTFGSLNPTGHAAIYLPEICAASPTQLRHCAPGEGGAVISRYYNVAGYDWIAIPLLPYLYAVNSLDAIPQYANAQLVAELRDSYRQEHLLALVPNDAHGHAVKADWKQLVGAAYIRKIYGFRIKTSPEQDEAFIQYLNNRKNKSNFSLFFSNCADFAREVLNFYEPHSVHRNFLADAGITTPKQVARSLTGYAHRYPELAISSFQIQQVPGTIKRSKHPDSVAEALLKSKKYLVPLAIFSPITTCSIGVAYLTGRFNPRKSAQNFDIAAAFQPKNTVASAATSTAPDYGSAGRMAATVTSGGNWAAQIK